MPPRATCPITAILAYKPDRGWLPQVVDILPGSGIRLLGTYGCNMEAIISVCS